MKQLSLFAVLLCCACGLRAATVSGTVTNSVTGAPQPNMNVMIADSMSTPLYSAWATTNSSGVYTFTLPSGVNIGDKLDLTMYDSCGARKSSTHTFTGANITSNFSGCPAPPPARYIQGYVLLPGVWSGAGARYYTVYVIRKQYDPVIMDTTLTVVDSINASDPSGSYSLRYTTATLPAGQLYVKAALNPLDSLYANYLPAYHDSALTWNTARRLTPADHLISGQVNITLPQGTNPGGPGFIGGSVLAGANKSSGVGDPLNKRLVKLVNAATNRPVAYKYSDAAGKFSFSNLAYGTYKIFGDVMGKSNPELTLTISAAKPGYSNILFEENNKTFKGQIGGLGAGGGAGLEGASVYPNPVTDLVRFKGLGAIAGAKTVVLSDITGAVISRQQFAAGVGVEVSTRNLPGGVYMLQLTTEAGSTSFRVVK